MISVILVEPQTEGNIGAIARAMKNFGFKELILVNPKCEIGVEARNRAKHAQDILNEAKILKNFPKKDYLIGTSARQSRDYNVQRNYLTPEKLSKIMPEGDVGIVFGRESDGLRNDEIRKCDFLVSIPVTEEYASLNLSHAVAVILYELSKKKLKSLEHIRPISLVEKTQLQKMINEALGKMKFSCQKKVKTQKIVWQRIIGKSFLTKREAAALMGFFSKIIKNDKTDEED